MRVFLKFGAAVVSVLFATALTGCGGTVGSRGNDGPTGSSPIEEIDKQMAAAENLLLASDQPRPLELCVNYIAMCEQGLVICLEGQNATTFSDFCAHLADRCNTTVATYCDGDNDAGSPTIPPAEIDAGSADAGYPSGTPADAGSLGNVLADVVVTELSYADGTFSCIVKNQGAAATPSGVQVGVAYSVDGLQRTWGVVSGPLSAGASVTIGTGGGSYTIPSGTHTITAYADDVNRFPESNESNNVLFKSVDIGSPCVDQTCSGHGTCEVNAGNASCACDDGYHADGLTCIAAAAAPCTKRAGTGAPFATIQAAASAAVPGDVICVVAGTYTLSAPIVVRTKGTAAAPVEIRAEGSVTLTDPHSNLWVWSGMFQVENAAWVTLRGFHLVEISWFGVMITNSDHVTVDGFKTERSRGSGITAMGSTNVTVTNNDIGFCCLGTSSVRNENGPVGSQECISIGGTNYFDVGYNHVHDSPVGETGGEGIDAKGGSRHGRIHHNRVHNLVRLGIYVDSYGTTGDIEIDSNEVFETYTGIVIAAESNHLVSGIRIHDNIVHHNGGDWAPKSPAVPWRESCGISMPNYDADGPRSDIAIYNNTIVANTYQGQGVGIRVQTTNASNVVVRNNLIAGQSDGLVAALAASVTAANNLVYPFAASSGEIEGSAAVHQAPLFVNETGRNYHLQAGSPAIDRGAAGPPVASVDADGRPRVVGSAVDLGAYEYDPAAP